MKESELITGLTYLGVAFGKEYTETEARIYYDQLKDYSAEVFTEAIKKIVKNNKFAPKIADLIEVMEDKKTATKIPVIDYMQLCGYFKRPSDYLNIILREIEEVKSKEELNEEDIDFLEELEKKKSEIVQRMEVEELHSIEKAKMWVLNDTVPEWLLEDMRKYYHQMQKEKITYKDVKLLESKQEESI